MFKECDLIKQIQQSYETDMVLEGFIRILRVISFQKKSTWNINTSRGILHRTFKGSPRGTTEEPVMVFEKLYTFLRVL